MLRDNGFNSRHAVITGYNFFRNNTKLLYEVDNRKEFIMELEITQREALIAFGFMALGLGYLIGRTTAEAEFILQIEEFQANGGKIIPPEVEPIEVIPISVETI